MAAGPTRSSTTSCAIGASTTPANLPSEELAQAGRYPSLGEDEAVGVQHADGGFALRAVPSLPSTLRRLKPRTPTASSCSWTAPLVRHTDVACGGPLRRGAPLDDRVLSVGGKTGRPDNLSASLAGLRGCRCQDGTLGTEMRLASDLVWEVKINHSNFK